MPSRLLPKKALKARPLVVIDLSDRMTRAIVLQWIGEDFAVRDYSFIEAPGLLSNMTRGELAAHLRTLVGSLRIKCHNAILVLGMQDVLVRWLELPRSHDTDFREMVKLNTGKYFQQDASQLVLDCFSVTGNFTGNSTTAKDAHVVAVAVKQQLFRVLLAAAGDAGLNLLRVTSAHTSLANAGRFAQPESLGNQVLALIEFGPKTCAITAVVQGQPALTRVLELDEATSTGLDEAFATPYPVADEIRANLIRNRLQKALFPVGREISAAIDYFEAQLNCGITTAVFTGGTERAELTMETLQAQLDIPCQRIDVSSMVKIDVANGKGERAPRELPRFAGCVGAAAAHYVPTLVQMSFLAERLEQRAAARRDPLRRAIFAATAALIGMLAWAGYVHLDLSRTEVDLAQLQAQLTSMKGDASDAAKTTTAAQTLAATLAALDQHSTNRFLAAPALDALQDTVVGGVQVINFSMQQNLQTVPGIRAGRKPDGTRTAGRQGYTKEQISLVIQAKNFGDIKAADRFMDAIANHKYFQASLRTVDAVTLKNRTPKQADPLDPEKVFTVFTIECAYPERTLGHE
jgi:Tfp pilus assembly PilM family ATPase